MRRALLAFIVGCAPGVGAESLALPSVDVYAAEIQPVLATGCATLDCHGDPGRPLRLFAEVGLRASPMLRGSPITRGELEANVLSLVAVDPGRPAPQHLAVLKPLAEAEGGMRHVGGALWGTPDHPAHQCLRSFLDGAVDAPACADGRRLAPGR